MIYPQWATPVRRAHLIRLFGTTKTVDAPYDLKGFCLDDRCHKLDAAGLPLECSTCFMCRFNYENYIENIIAYWKADDKAEDAALWRLERKLLHAAPLKRGRWGSQFDPVAKDQFFAQRQPFYLEATGVSGLAFTRVAKIRIPGTQTRLFVEVPRTKGLSKNAKRKLERYGNERLLKAVKEYWDNR
jgi:hypothetical protein